MKKSLLILAVLLSLLLVGCGVTKEEQAMIDNYSKLEQQVKDLQKKLGEKPVEDLDNKLDEEPVNQNELFDKYNILSFGEIEVDDSKDYEGDKFIDIKSKVTNNSSEIAKTITVSFYFYDEQNTIIDSTHPQEGSSIEPNQSFYIEAMYTRDLNVKDIKINKYTYYIGDTYYSVDLVSKTAEVWD